MKFRFWIFLFSLGFLVASCASAENNDKVASNNDKVAFTQLVSGDSFQMELNSEKVTPLVDETENSKKWENQKLVLNATCGSSNGLDAPILVFSPDGEPVGFLDDSWKPSWSPDGERIAVACGTDENGNVVVVSNTEHSGSTTSWSRSGSGKLSDRMEVFIVTPDGSNVLQITLNESGDWLPRWFPSNNYSPDSTLARLVASENPILLETNRNGKSEIVILSTTSTKKWFISSEYPKGQSPAWSENGSFVAFSGGELDESIIYLALDTAEKGIIRTSQQGLPIPWGN